MRLPKTHTLARLITVMREGYFLTPALRNLRSHFAKSKPQIDTPVTPVVLIQCIEDYFFFALFGRILAGLSACGPLRVDQYSLRSLRWGTTTSLRQTFWNFVHQNGLSDWRWRRLYSAFADRTAYCASGWLFPWTALHLWWRAWRLWRRLKSVEDLVQLTVDGIQIGDLVIDSYIRFKPAPSPIFGDFYLLAVIRQALKDVSKATRYFKKNKPALLLTSYVTYIQHGIAARAALLNGAHVLAFGTLQDFATAVTVEHPWHTRDTKNYKSDFLALPDKEERIVAAEQQLVERLSGRIDAATSYMKASAYRSTTGKAFDVAGMPVIFLHDFYDSVHLYRWICFHDFWNWACFTIDTLQSAGIAFAIKPHPNEVATSSKVMNQLLAKYPTLNIIPVEVTNDQLARGGMSCAVTVYGTVASEMAFMGIPTISCGDNPHISFDFCHTAKTQEEYRNLLLNNRNLNGVPAEMRRESCMFYYMHNLNLDRGQKVLKDKILELRRRLFYVDSPAPPGEIASAAADFIAGNALQSYCSALYDAMQEHVTARRAGS